MTARALFVTATGTDVGKTHVSCALLSHWRGQGRAVDALKPVLSGFAPDEAADTDAGRLLQALGRPVDGPHLDAMSPHRFGPPLSPDQAARAEGRALTAEAVIATARAFLQRTAAEVALVEGVGGAMVPIDEHHTVLDVIDALSVPVLLVADDGLGTLSHTLCAHRALTARGLAVFTALNLRHADAPDPAAQLRSLRAHLAGPVEPYEDGARLAAALDVWPAFSSR